MPLFEDEGIKALTEDDEDELWKRRPTNVQDQGAFNVLRLRAPFNENTLPGYMCIKEFLVYTDFLCNIPFPQKSDDAISVHALSSYFECFTSGIYGLACRMHTIAFCEHFSAGGVILLWCHRCVISPMGVARALLVVNVG